MDKKELEDIVEQVVENQEEIEKVLNQKTLSNLELPNPPEYLLREFD